MVFKKEILKSQQNQAEISELLGNIQKEHPGLHKKVCSKQSLI